MAGELGAAAGGANMLQEILRRRFSEALTLRQQKLAEQRQREQSAYQAEALRSLQESRAANQALQRQQGAQKLAGTLAPGSTLDASAAETLRGGDLGSLIEH